ncbi:hypothetical protein J6590_105626, partial [Homalodisca vitripennis]
YCVLLDQYNLLRKLAHFISAPLLALGVFWLDTVNENIMEYEGNWYCLSQFVRGILLEKKPDLAREVGKPVFGNPTLQNGHLRA